jgi:hypothetical protein
MMPPRPRPSPRAPLRQQRPRPAEVPLDHDLAEAASVAAAFAADYLSWDEAEPSRRGRALAPYLAGFVVEEDLWHVGWSGAGRQRVDIALPGTTGRLSPGRVLVHVRVRVTPYVRLTAPAPDRRDTVDLLPVPAAAPALAATGWKSIGAYWYEVLVPMTATRGCWLVDLVGVSVVPPPPAAALQVAP